MAANEVCGVYVPVRAVVTLALCCLVVEFGATAVARTTGCGATIVDDLKLDEDLLCAGNGLIVGVDGIRVNLNGHSIAGAGVGIGIDVSGRHGVTIVGGTIEHFATGIRLLNSSDIDIKGNEIRDNAGDGLDVQAGSTAVSIKDNVLVGSGMRGIMLRSNTSDNEIKDNRFDGNRVGILLFGPLDTTIKDNVVSTSAVAGIRVNFPATGNVLAENLVTINPIGIDFLVGPAGGPVGNTLLENTIVNNTCGLHGPLDATVFKENTFVDNTTDICTS